MNAIYQEKHSWRETGKAYDITPATARRIARGYNPGRKIRARLSLPPQSTVVVIGGENIPDGAQVFKATRCECGQWFISNHPRRKRCFICSPFKGMMRNIRLAPLPHEVRND